MTRPSEDLLAQLIASAEGQPVNFVILQAMVEEATPKEEELFDSKYKEE